MKKYVLIILSLVVVGLVSCEKSTMRNDTTKPVIHSARFNLNDTLIYKLESLDPNVSIPIKYDTLIVNTRDASIMALDTIVVPNKVHLTARFTDDKELSSIKLYLDVMSHNIGQVGDTAISKFCTHTVFGPKDTTLYRVPLEMELPDSIQGMVGNKSMKRPVRSGEYRVRLYSVDSSGHEDSISQIVYLIHGTEYYNLMRP